MPEPAEKVRIDLWLWAARFFRSRSLAKAAVQGGKVHLDGERVKPSHGVREGAVVTITRQEHRQEVIVQALAVKRGSAQIAQTLYEETPESLEERTRTMAVRRLARAGLNAPRGRPDRRGRAALKALKETTDEP